MDVWTVVVAYQQLQLWRSKKKFPNRTYSISRVESLLYFFIVLYTIRSNIFKILLRSSYLIPSKIKAIPEIAQMLVTMDKIDKMPSPRVIKSHLALHLLNPNLLDTCKVNISIPLSHKLWPSYQSTIIIATDLFRLGGVRRSKSKRRHRVFLFSS